jgi:hypothetical protein
MLGQEVEGLLHAGQHPQGEDVDLHELEGIDVILVPFDHLAVDHGGGLDRHEVVEPVVGEDEAARVLAEMARRPHKLAGEIERQAQASVRKVEVQRLDVLVLDALLRPTPDLRRQHLDEVFGEPQRLADVADRALGAITNHGRAEGGVIAPVLVEDPLHDDFAPFMFEVDVNVRRFVALFRDEALEQQVISCGIDRGDPQDVADSAIRGAAAALAKNVLRPRKVHDRMDGQEVWRIAQPLDQIEFVAKGLDHIVGQPLGIPPGRAFPGQTFQGLLRGERGIRALLGILVRQLVEREAATLHDFDRSRQRIGIACEQPVHLLR